MKVLFFASAREEIGRNEDTFEDEISSLRSVEDIKKMILAKYPCLTDILAESAIAVNESYVRKETMLDLKQTDTIAVIPPVSGG